MSHFQFFLLACIFDVLSSVLLSSVSSYLSKHFVKILTPCRKVCYHLRPVFAVFRRTDQILVQSLPLFPYCVFWWPCVLSSELRPSSLFNRTNIIHKTISLSRRINILCIYVRLGCFFYNIAAHRVICDSYHLTDKVENTF